MRVTRKIKIRVTYDIRFHNLIRALQSTGSRYARNTDRIFLNPARNIVWEIKRKVRGSKQFNHIFKKNLYKNIRAEFVKRPTIGPTGASAEIGIGYFVPYGANLELGSPPYDPGIDIMVEWASVKLRQKGRYNKAEANKWGRSVRRKIKRYGSKPRPIIAPTVNAMIQDYYSEVFRVFAKTVFKVK